MKYSAPRILLIDDDPLFRGMVASLLSVKYQVEVAGGGSEGFYHALENPPHIAIIDVRMPGWDGLTTLKAFRSHPQLCDVKTVMLTSDATRTTVLDAISAGADDYVIKTSFTKKSFTEILDNLLHEPAKTALGSELDPSQNHAHLEKSRSIENNAETESFGLESHVVPDSTNNAFETHRSEDAPCLQDIIDSWE